MDFTVNGVEAGQGASEIQLDRPGSARVKLRAAALLDAAPNDLIRSTRYDAAPYWDIERARVGTARNVSVEIVVNGVVAARQPLAADGGIHDLSFDVPLERSSWVAARILPSSHTNPVFAIVAGKPIRGPRASVEWCLNAVNQCWTQKAPQIRAAEREDARQAYEHARGVYKQRLAEVEGSR
jgi:hypothetical protein